MSTKWLAALTVLLSVAVGYVTNLLTERWSWGLGIGFAVLVGGLVAVTVRATGSDAGADATFRIETASGGRVARNRLTGGRPARFRLRATRRGTISGNRANMADGDTVLRARGGEIEDNRLEGR
ncbi:hypothetical protein [Streptomyces antibioticus]|uniref:hypothetical protein n=1 Tax=Streptomyces antibioticus TaxID=1890 RepID=UPI0036D7E85D